MASFTASAHTPAADQNHDSIPNYVAPRTPNDSSADPVDITAWQQMLSATSGSLLTGLLATPLDVVRVRLQSQSLSQPPTIDFTKLAMPTSTVPGGFRPSSLGVTACCREVFFTNNTAEACVVGPRLPLSGITSSASSSSSASAIACAVEETQQRTFNSTVDGLRKIARNEGVTTLWRGLSPTLLMAIPANIIYFTGYEWLRFNRASPIARTVRDEYAPLVAGAAARLVAAAAVSPIELFRTRLQAVRGVPDGRRHLADTFRGITDMVAAHGYRSLWRGLTLTLWRDVPFSGMYWWGYETIRGRLIDARERRGRSLEVDLGREGSEARAKRRRRSRSRENHADTFADSFIAGAASGGFASVATMPFDVGKTRTQVFRDASFSSSSASAAAAAAPEERSMARLLWHIFRTEGVPGLFRGWIPRTLRVAPACAIMISSYEVGKRVFRGVNERALEEEGRRGREREREP
ncbi:mitochondrial carrier protein MTM1 [Staphylotrichum tortipilum]|uniref:Mitochondrial carrier protein MTM1 n=1 Tax=Staphylotrichum tortipilum TaxID=2831512 RepID=A0AAN6RWE9_9PEZI|nr:mitochondrial carrier protein MTM1 [Staphylotrichum longicolle]